MQRYKNSISLLAFVRSTLLAFIGLAAMLGFPFVGSYGGLHVGVFLVNSSHDPECGWAVLFPTLFGALVGTLLGFLIGCGLGVAVLAAILRKIG